LAHPVQVACNNIALIVEVRKWLERRRQQSRKDCYGWQRAAGLTEDRRVELQLKIHAWRESHMVITPNSQHVQNIQNICNIKHASVTAKV